MNDVNVSLLTPSPLNSAPVFQMTLPASSGVINFYLSQRVVNPAIELEFDYPCAQIKQSPDSPLIYLFTSPRLTTPGKWELEWLTDFGASLRPFEFKVTDVSSDQLRADIDGWIDGEQTINNLLPLTLPHQL